MGLFGKKKTEYPKMPQGDYAPVLRCSICTGEQEGFCAANGISQEDIEKIY